MSKKTCRICQETKNEEDMQELNCHHTFCSMCMIVYPGTLCPARFCEGTRSTDIVVDEMSGMDESKSASISFGSNPSLFKLDIGEKQKCDAIRKTHHCVNIARMVLVHCRHRFCYDCLMEKIQFAFDNKTIPFCPMSRCCNRLSPSEVLCSMSAANSISWDPSQPSNQISKIQKLCEALEKQLPKCDVPTELVTGQDIKIECFLYGHEQNKKSIILPKVAFVVDAVNAVIQVMRIGNSHATSSLDVFIRKRCGEKKEKYKYEKVITEGKCSLKDAMWTTTTTIVIDADCQILKARRIR